jgi:hypothetical protein
VQTNSNKNVKMFLLVLMISFPFLSAKIPPWLA